VRPTTEFAREGDVTRETDIVRAIERCLAEFGNLDILVNNAGTSSRRHHPELFSSAAARS